MHARSVDLSVIVPLYREPGCVPICIEGLGAPLDRLEGTAEILFVDDASGDGTWEAVRRAAGKDPRVRGVRLTKNVGLPRAVLAGIDHARGGRIVTFPADGEIGADAIPTLLAALDDGFDLALARREARGGGPLRRLRTLALRLWVRLRTGLAMRDPGCFCGAMTADLARQVMDLESGGRLVKFAAARLASRWREVPVPPGSRRVGRSPFGLPKTIRAGWEILTQMRFVRCAWRKPPWRVAELAGAGTLPRAAEAVP